MSRENKFVKREKWSKDFGSWFRDILLSAEILDYRYPIKGFGVWMPYGFKIRQNILQIMRDLLDVTGHNEVLFPTLIPEYLLAKEAEHVRSFEEECYWVTHGGSTPLQVRYALRPTSETAIMPMVRLWVRSHADLPVKLYQIVSIFRYETKATRPILRMREVASFKEAHTVHATAEEAEAQVREGVEIYKRFFDEICVSYLVSKRPDWDKFAGAEYTIAFDMVCPDGRVLQIGTVHNLGQNFTKAFEIDYETPDGRREYAWSTSYGISGRAIAAPIILHGDDHGMVLPPKVAPIQVVVIPIPYKGREEQVVDVSKRLEETLKSSGIRARADLRDDLTPGAKFYYWEKRGVPIRAEIGPRDVDRREVTLVRRDTLERTTCRMDDVVECVKALMEAMTKDMRERAWEWLRSHVKRVGSLEEARQLLKQRSGVVELLWCGRDECGLKMEEALSARLLGTPFGEEEAPVEGRCVICGAEAKCVVRAAVTY